MITIIEGLPGHGKSYEAVAFYIIPAIVNDRRKVITNIPLNIDKFVAVFGEYTRDLIEVRTPKGLFVDNKNADEGDIYIPFSDPSEFLTDWRNSKNQGPMFVVDEAQFPMPNTKSPRTEQLLLMATMHRHHGQDWVLLSQIRGQIYTKIAALSEAVIRVRKKTFLGFLGDRSSYWRFLYPSYGLKDRDYVRKETRKYKEAFFPFYKSHTHSDGAVVEHTGYEKGMSFKLIILFSLALVIYSAYAYFSFSGTFFGDDPDVITAEIFEDDIAFDESVDPSVAISQETYPEDVSLKPDAVATEEKTESYVLDNYVDIKRDVIKRDTAKTVEEVKRPPLDKHKIYYSGKHEYKDKLSYVFDVYEGLSVVQMTGEQIGHLNYSIRKLNDCVFLFDHPNGSDPFYVTCHKPIFNKNDVESVDDSAINGGFSL